jgi:hypothetical protein
MTEQPQVPDQSTRIGAAEADPEGLHRATAGRDVESQDVRMDDESGQSASSDRR